MWSEAKTQIGTLQVRGAARDDPALRLAVSSQLGGAEFRPSGMPPAAILIVRRLSDPLPGRVPIRGACTRRCTDWERAVKGRLSELYRHAVRPHHGQAAGHADAVIFADEAELLACLVLDLSRRTVGQRWWWQHFSKRLSTSSGVSGSIRQLLSEKVIYLPAVLDHLTRWGKVESVMRALSADDTLNVLSAVTEAYLLGEIKAGLIVTGRDLPASASVSTKPLHGEGIGSKKSKFKELSFPGEFQKPASWLQRLGMTNLPTGLSKEQTCLWGLGLMLHRMPSIVRSSEFQKLVIDWWNKGDPQSAGIKISPPAGSDASTVFDEIEEFNHDGKTQAKSKDPPSTLRQKDPPDETPETSRDSDRVKSNRELTADAHPENLKAKRKQRPISEQKPEKFISSSSESSEPFASDLKTKDRRALDPETVTDTADILDGEQEATPPSTRIPEIQDVLPESEEFVSTRLGGVLYLINLMAQLDLPHCFEKEWRLASQLGAWGLLELLGRALLEDGSKGLDEDPLWTVLAELDGRRPGELPGRTFVGNETFRMPASWFKQVRKDRETFRWAAMRRQLRLWSSAGYLIVEAPRDKNPPHHQAEMELQTYMGSKRRYLLSRTPFSKAPVDCPEHFKTSGLNKDLLHWLVLTLPYIRYRLRLAFETDSGWNSTIAKQLFACPGKLYVTSTHVDFVTDINNISIPIRRAGLDRDPGWNPDLGRVVQFHFE